MELKIVKTSQEDYKTLYQKYLKEMNVDSAYEFNKSFYEKNEDKNAIIIYNNNIPLGFISYKYDIFNLISNHMYIDPTVREVGIEEIIIKVLENSYNKRIHIIIKNNDSFMMKALKVLGYYRSSLKNIPSLKKHYEIYSKDNNYRYQKIIINLNCLFDKESKLKYTCKKILKLYSIKPRKETIKAYINSIKQIDYKLQVHEISEETYFKERFQKYMNQYNIRIDPTLCYRLYNSSKISLVDGAKKFLKICGKHKHIFILSSLKPNDLEEMISSLKLKNISKVYNMPISYESIQKIIKNNKYRDIMEFCYIDNRIISLEMLKAGIDTILISSNLDAQNSFYFKKQALNYKELTKIIMKK